MGFEKCASGGDFRAGSWAGIEPPAVRSKNFYVTQSGGGPAHHRKWLSQGVEPGSPCFRSFCWGQSDPGTRTSLRKWLSGWGASGAAVVMREPKKSGGVDPRGWPGSAKLRRTRAAETPYISAFQCRRAPHIFRRRCAPTPQVCNSCFWAIE